jgi:hypothetical protein
LENGAHELPLDNMDMPGALDKREVYYLGHPYALNVTAVCGIQNTNNRKQKHGKSKSVFIYCAIFGLNLKSAFTNPHS